MSSIWRRLRRSSPTPGDTTEDGARLVRESRRTAENDARGRASERTALSQAAENEARRQASDARARTQAAENEVRRQASDAEAHRQGVENEARHLSAEADHDGGRPA